MGSGTCGDANHPTPTVTRSQDPFYGKIWKINKPRGRKRAEFARTSYLPQNGQLLYYGWRWKMTSTSPLKNGMAVWQWKTDPGRQTDTQNYPLGMSYNGKTLSLNAYGPGFPDWTQGSSINNRRTIIWTKDVRPGQWVSLVIGLKLSRNQNQGYVEVWFNGQKQTLKNSNYKEYQVRLSNDRKRAYHKTFDGSTVYPKWGAYGSGACGYNVSTYYDDMKIGRTLAAAMPSGNHTAPPNGGIEGIYYFQNIATGRYLDSNGTTLTTSTQRSGSDKQWRIVSTDGGHYNIDCMFKGRGILETQANRSVRNSSIQPKGQGYRHDIREWKPEALGNNTYRFKNRYGNRGYLAEKTTNHDLEYTNWDGKRARWKLIRINSNKVKVNNDIAENPELNFSIYPNPAHSLFTIHIDEIEKNTVITIFNIAGQKMYETLTSEKTYTIDTDRFSAGVYFVHVETSGLSETKKLIIN